MPSIPIRVIAIDLAAKRVQLAGGDTLHYDLLVYALGSRADVDGVEGPRRPVHHRSGRLLSPTRVTIESRATASVRR